MQNEDINNSEYNKAIEDALRALCLECSVKQNGGKCSKCEKYKAIETLLH